MSKWDDLFTPSESPPTNRLAVVPTNGSGTATSYATAALRKEAEIVANSPEGQRNETLNKAWFNMGRHVGAGNIDAGTVRATLADAGHACGLPQHEIDLILRDGPTSALNAGAALPRHPPPLTPVPDVTILELDQAEADAFWDARPHLRYLHDYARARRVSPWALLGTTLARIVTAIPHFVVLPPLVGHQASLNLFIGLVGRSGAGKGAAEAAAAAALDVGDIATHKTGSGEGIAHAYMRREKGEVIQHCHAVCFSVPEIDTLSALGDRRGATLLPELRSAWSGETLGFQYADPSRRLPVPAHQYRLCLVTGIQPGRAKTLLEDADGGTPQRFLWLPATDPDAPDTAPPPPPRMHWNAPDTSPRSIFRTPTGRLEMHVCDQAAKVIDEASRGRLRGEGDALDGHALLARLKIAAALACLDGRLDISDQDWELAGTVHRKSDTTRGHVQAALQRAARDTNIARAEAEASRAVVVADRVADAATKRVCGVLFRKLQREGDWLTRSALRKATAASDRGRFEEAVDRLLEAGQIETDTTEKDPTGHGGNGSRYRIRGGLKS